jgi:hypothetical protein
MNSVALTGAGQTTAFAYGRPRHAGHSRARRPLERLDALVEQPSCARMAGGGCQAIEQSPYHFPRLMSYQFNRPQVQFVRESGAIAFRS